MLQTLFVFITYFICSTNTAFAGSLTAELDRNHVDVGDAAQLSVTVSGSIKDDIAIPPVAGLSFQQIGTSTNVQIVNGSFSKETTYNFSVTSDRAGTFQIPSIKANIDKEEVATPPLTITFGGGAGSPGKVPNAPPPPAGSGGEQDAKSGAGEPPFLFIERELSNQAPYEGEAILSTIRVFQRARVTSLVPERASSPDWRIMSKEGQKSYETVRDGVRWRVIELSEVLIPLKSGSLPSPTFSLQATYIQPSTKQRIRRNSIWDLFQGGMMDMGQEVAKKISSESRPILVKPLPTVGRPQVTSDMVGDFKLSVDVSKRTLSPGETATISVRVSGRGALDRMADIKLPPLVGARIYPDKPQLKETVDESGLKSSRELKFAIVPSQAGEQNLGSIELGVFNPTAGKWATLKEDLGVINVTGGALSQSSSPQGAPGGIAQSQTPDSANQLPGASTNHNQTVVQDKANPVDITPAKDAGAMNESVAKKWFGFAILLISILAAMALAKPMTKRFKTWRNTRIVSKTPFAALQKFIQPQSLRSQSAVAPIWIELQRLAASPGHDPQAMTSKDILEFMLGSGVPTEIITKLESSLHRIESNTYRGIDLDPASIDDFFAVLAQLASWEKL